MGCVNDKQSRKISKYQQDKVITQPQLIYDENHIKTPHIQVTQRACGYLFQQQDAYNNQQIKRTRTQITVQSRTPHVLEQLQGLMQKCRFFYKQHDIDTANQYLQMIENLQQKYKYSEHYQKQIQESVKKNRNLMQCVREQYNDIVKFQHELLKGGWDEKSNRKGIKVSTRRQNGTVGVLIQSIVDQPFQVLISFCIQMDLYKEFMPWMKVSRQEKIVSRNCRIGFTQNHIPLLSVRQAFFQGIGYNRLHKNNTLFLFTRSIHNRPDLQQKLGYKCQVHPDWVQLQYKYFVISYQPICKGKGKIVLAMNVDTKLNFIPMWLQDKISQDFGEEFFQNIMRLSKDFKNSQWQKNTQKNSEIFNFFKNAIDNRLLEMQQIQKSLMKQNMSCSTNIISNL